MAGCFASFLAGMLRLFDIDSSVILSEEEHYKIIFLSNSLRQMYYRKQTSGMLHCSTTFSYDEYLPFEKVKHVAAIKCHHI